MNYCVRISCSLFVTIFISRLSVKDFLTFARETHSLSTFSHFLFCPSNFYLQFFKVGPTFRNNQSLKYRFANLLSNLSLKTIMFLFFIELIFSRRKQVSFCSHTTSEQTSNIIWDFIFASIQNFSSAMINHKLNYFITSLFFNI